MTLFLLLTCTLSVAWFEISDIRRPPGAKRPTDEQKNRYRLANRPPAAAEESHVLERPADAGWTIVYREGVTP